MSWNMVRLNWKIHSNALNKKDRVLLLDDLLATGGTSVAACELIEGLGAEIVGCAFVIELDGLKGRDRLAGHGIHSLLHY